MNGTRSLVPLGRRPLEAKYEEMLRIVAASEQGHHTRKAYLTHLGLFFQWLSAAACGGQGQIDRETVQRYREELKSKGNQANTINLKLAAIRRLAKEMYLAGHISAQQRDGIVAVQQVPLVRRKGQSTSLKARWLSLEELKRLLEVRLFLNKDKQQRYEAMIHVLALTGLRIEELASLKPHNFGFLDGRPALIGVRTKGGFESNFPLPEAAFEKVKPFLAAAPEAQPGDRKEEEEDEENKEGRVFGLEASGIRYVLQKASDRVGIKFAPHDLRRSFAKLAKEAGASLDDICLHLGHSSPRTTMRYLGDTRNYKESPADSLAAALGRKGGE